YLAQNGSNVVVELDGDPGNDTPDVQNSSLINAGKGGTIVLAAGDTFSRAIRNSGWLVASSGTIAAHAARVENRGVIHASASLSADGDGGKVVLSGLEEVKITSPENYVQANAGLNGDGGTITLQSEGTVTIGAGTFVSAAGGSASGDGGSINITAEDFSITGMVDASPQNKDYEPGKLEIHTTTATIANGANTGATDTIYEQDIENWGAKGTGVDVYASRLITVNNIVDDEIKGRYGDFGLHATGGDGMVWFQDTGDTISTTLGDITMTAGGPGIIAGSMETGKDVSDARPTPGAITLTTSEGGDIRVENLTIKSGWGLAEINVDAAGDLTVNGDVTVGRDSPIQNVPGGHDAEAAILLKAGDNVVLNGDVYAASQGTDDVFDNVTKSHIGIFSGTNEFGYGDMTINGDLVAIAKASSNGTSEATIEVGAWGSLTWGPDAAPPVADADRVAVTAEDYTSIEDASNTGDTAKIIINEQGNVPLLKGFPDFAESHMNTIINGDVVANDYDPDGDTITATLVTDVAHGTLTLNSNGTYSYKPDAGYVGTDSFTYMASDGVGTSGPVVVTITLTNTLPILAPDVATTPARTAVIINVLANDSDPDGDLLTAALVSGPTHGGVVLNADGTFTYYPGDSFTGQDSFVYSATDGQTGAALGQTTVTITIGSGGTPPAPPLPSLGTPPAPGLARVEFEVSGCPALVKWTAQEIGVSEKVLAIWIGSAMGTAGDIQPCDACARFKAAAEILQDADGTYARALAQVVNEFASNVAPPTEEQMASIADAISRGAEAGTHYAVAGKYLDALATYIGILNDTMDFSVAEAIEFATQKYVAPLAQRGNLGAAAFIVARLTALRG
ncbi:MAG: Ig-like domain-containing protein, partial [Planctomycetota bacterium]